MGKLQQICGLLRRCAAKGNIVIKRNYSCGRLWSTCVAVHRRGRRDSDGTEEDERLAKCVTADGFSRTARTFTGLKNFNIFKFYLVKTYYIYC